MVRSAMAACVLACVLLASPAFAEPDVFSKAGYEADRAAAVEGGKLHIVFVSSDVCNASQVLERRRWTEPEIIEWMTANAVVSRLGLETAETQIRELGVLATPTTIVYRNDSEIGRASGAWWEEDLLMWLEHLSTGAPLDPAVADRIAENQSATPMLAWFFEDLAGADRLYLEGSMPFVLGEEDVVPLLERLDAARTTGDVESEVRLSLWLIRNGGRVFSVSTDLAGLAESNLVMGLHENRFGDTAIRDLTESLEAEARGFATLMPVEGGPEAEFEPLRTWVSLNQVVGNWDVLLDWTIDRLEIDEDEIQRSGFGFVCGEAAVRAKRWDVLAKLIPDPVGKVGEMLEIPMAAMGFEIMNGGDVDDAGMAQMRDTVAWGLYHPAIAAMVIDDDGATEARFVSEAEKGMVSADLWRVVILIAAGRCDRLNEEYIGWIDGHDLIGRYPQFAEPLKATRDAWQLR